MICAPTNKVRLNLSSLMGRGKDEDEEDEEADCWQSLCKLESRKEKELGDKILKLQ